METWLLNDIIYPIVMIGAGGHASVLADILLSQGREICAVIAPFDIKISSIFDGIPRYENDTDILIFNKDSVVLVNGIGMMPFNGQREKVGKYFSGLGYVFEKVISNSAVVSPNAVIEQGAQILHAAVIQIDVRIGENCIINTGAIIEHNCIVGDYCHIAPGTTICGGTTVKRNVFIGAGATVIQGISIESDSIIGAGVILRTNIDKISTVY